MYREKLTEAVQGGPRLTGTGVDQLRPTETDGGSLRPAARLVDLQGDCRTLLELMDAQSDGLRDGRMDKWTGSQRDGPTDMDGRVVVDGQTG